MSGGWGTPRMQPYPEVKLEPVEDLPKFRVTTPGDRALMRAAVDIYPATPLLLPQDEWAACGFPQPVKLRG